jgi:hypothetical protein
MTLTLPKPPASPQSVLIVPQIHFRASKPEAAEPGASRKKFLPRAYIFLPAGHHVDSGVERCRENRGEDLRFPISSSSGFSSPMLGLPRGGPDFFCLARSRFAPTFRRIYRSISRSISRSIFRRISRRISRRPSPPFPSPPSLPAFPPHRLSHKRSFFRCFPEFRLFSQNKRKNFLYSGETSVWNRFRQKIKEISASISRLFPEFDKIAEIFSSIPPTGAPRATDNYRTPTPVRHTDTRQTHRHPSDTPIPVRHTDTRRANRLPFRTHRPPPPRTKLKTPRRHTAAGPWD